MIVSINVSAVNCLSECLYVALYKALHEALLKLYKDSALTSIQSSTKALLNTLPKPLQELCLCGE